MSDEQDLNQDPVELDDAPVTAYEPEKIAANPAARLAKLKERARMMGIKHSNNISADKLAEKIQARMEGRDDTEVKEDVSEADEELPHKDQARRRIEKYNDAMKLVRLRIACLNPQKRDLPGEILTVSSRLTGPVRKFVLYGERTDNGYHVPNIIYKMMKERKFLSVKEVKDRQTGRIYPEEQWVSEYSLEVLDPLTPKELKELANQQAAADGRL